jgi:hypothetical protein
MCTLELIRSILNNSSIVDKYKLLGDFYQYFTDTKALATSHNDSHNSNSVDDNGYETTDDEMNDDDVHLIWKPKRQIKPNKTRANLYELILKHKWNSINWLIIDKFNMPRMRILITCINTDNYTLALNLFDVATNPDAFYAELYGHRLDNGRNILHHLCMHEPATDTNPPPHNSTYNLLLNRIFAVNIKKFAKHVEQLLFAKDDFFCLPMHYACQTHNFTLIDYMFGVLKAAYPTDYADKCSDLLVKHMDNKEQYSYGLLYWRIGKKAAYSVDCLSRISELTRLCASNMNLNLIRACYPLNDVCNFEYDQADEGCGSYLQLLMTGDTDQQSSDDRLLVHMSPLLYAINQQDVAMCDYLVNQLKINVTQYDNNRVGSLVYAIRVNNLDLVKLLLTSRPDAIDLYEVDSNGQTFLHHMANPLAVHNYAYVNTAILKYILYESNCIRDAAIFCALIKQTDCKSKTSIDYAFMSGNLDMVRELLTYLKCAPAEIQKMLVDRKTDFHVNDQYYMGEYG